MALLQPLIGFSLRQVLGDDELDAAALGEAVGSVGGQVIKVVANHFRDHSQTLPRALKRAHDKSWHALGVALGGNGLFDWLKRQFASGDDKGLRQQVAEFLKSDAASFPGTSDQFRSACLKEYQRAGRTGLFRMDVVDEGAAAQQAATFNRYTNTPALIQGTNAVMEQVGQQIADDYPNLAQLVSLPTTGGIPLLAAAFTYFFRREVEKDDELFNGLAFDLLRRLTATQAKAFATMMDQLDDIATDVKDIKLDTTEIKELLKGFRPGVSYENEGERAFLRQQREKFRKLPRSQQTATDWSNMADRLSEAHLFAEAREEHENAARRALEEHDVSLAAREHVKAYRAACEKEQWSEALASLGQAVQLDPRCAPFDMEQYQPVEILGAGGFGTVFKCRDVFLNRDVAIKTLYANELARNNIQEVFSEANILTNLQHPAIIGVIAAGYCNRQPFIIMEYFPSKSLSVRLKHQGTLSVADFLIAARQVAEALRAAHDIRPQPVYHRDVKPDNVLVRKLGEQWHVKVIDFGLAVRSQAIHKSFSRPVELRSRMEQSYAGTVDYAPPEQKGKLAVAVGPYSDIFAFGKMCCEALVGVTEPKRYDWVRDKDPIPAALADLLELCTDQNVTKRPQRFQEVLDVLDAVADELDPVKRRREEEERRRKAAEQQRLAALAIEEQRQREQAEEEQRRREAAAAELGRKQAEQERRQLEQLQQEGEKRLAAAHRAELDRSGGKHLADDTELRRHYRLPNKRAEQIRKTVYELWLKANPPKKERQAGEIFTNSLGMKFAWIPPGTFVMGSPKSEPQRSDDEKQFGVCLTNDFYLGIHQVTQAQWRAIMGNAPSKFKGDDRPVEQVSWDDCQEFLKKLSQKDGKPYRLPTEAEWEYACRAGTTRPFHFKTISTELANYDGNYTYGDGKKGKYLNETTPVGSFPANPWGLFDMHGNVYEWCADWYGPYPETNLKDLNTYIIDPQGANSGSARVVRGGSWVDLPWRCRAAYRRSRDAPDDRNDILGCRVCFSLE